MPLKHLTCKSTHFSFVLIFLALFFDALLLSHPQVHLISVGYLLHFQFVIFFRVKKHFSILLLFKSDHYLVIKKPLCI